AVTGEPAPVPAAPRAQAASSSAASSKAASGKVASSKAGSSKAASSKAGSGNGAAQAAAPMPMAIKKMVFHAGQANFSDLSVQPNFSTGIQSIEGSVIGLSSKANSRAKVDIHGAV